VSSGPCLRGLCFHGGSPRPRYSVIVTTPISRAHNEQVWCGLVAFGIQGIRVTTQLQLSTRNRPNNTSSDSSTANRWSTGSEICSGGTGSAGPRYQMLRIWVSSTVRPANLRCPSAPLDDSCSSRLRL
jgi:hypothetical protein